MIVPVPVPSRSVEAVLAELDEKWRARIARLEAGERKLRALVSVSRKIAARAARLQIERERQRLGRELHTGVGQLLAAVRIQVEIIDQILPEPPAAVAQALERIAGLASDALEQVRCVSRELYRPEWQQAPLEQALEALWQRSGVPERYRAILDLARLPQEPSAAVRALLYRAAQEAISNVVRHARATEVRLALESTDKEVMLTVTDNGEGFRTSDASGASEGIGLRSLRDEAAGLGAQLSIESGATGTKLRIAAPFTC